MPRSGPVELTTQGQTFVTGSRILTVIWVGTGAAADVAELRTRLTNELVWRGQADSANIYLGANFGPTGIHTPTGFHAARLPSGTALLVYLRED